MKRMSMLLGNALVGGKAIIHLPKVKIPSVFSSCVTTRARKRETINRKCCDMGNGTIDIPQTFLNSAENVSSSHPT